MSCLTSFWFFVILLPSIKMSPLVGETSPVMHLNSEDLPTPSVPRITKQELYLPSNVMLLTASLGSSNNPDYTLLTFCTVTALASIDEI